MSENNVIKVTPTQWNMMLILKDNIRALSSRNEEGKFDVCLRKEKSILRSYFKEVIGS